MPNRYTSKIRAKRIELHYFKRLHPFRRFKLILTIAVPAVAAGWLIVLAARGDQRVYNSGPVSTAHAMFEVQCGQCHVPGRAGTGQPGPARSGFWIRVSEQACLKCHDGPTHHDSQAFTPTCATCHVEHKGRVVLASMTNQHCTQCHAGLKTKDATPPAYERKIESFPANHPEFAVTVKEGDRALRVRLDDKARLTDTAQMKLNHQVHLKPGLKGVDDLKAQGGMKGLAVGPKGLQLECTFCHRPDGQQAYMEAINYVKHCADCHPLGFDAEKFPGAVVPHDKPVIVHAFLQTKYAEAPQGEKVDKGDKADKAGEEASQPRRRLGRQDAAEEERPRARIGGRRDEPEEKSGPKGFKEAESFLFENKQGCKLCHTLTAREKLPEVVATAIPARWLPHSRFDHGAHRPLSCTECHKAPQSTETKDVLLPAVASCRECHRASGGARAGCVECHRYHDRVKTRELNGPLTIREMLTGVSPSPAAAAAATGGVNKSR